MCTIDTSAFNSIIDNERRLYHEKKAFNENYIKCLYKEDQFMLSLMQQKKDDEKHCEKIRKDIGQMKTDMKSISVSIENLEKGNQNLRAQIKNIDKVIQNKMTDDDDVNPQYKNLTRRTRIFDKTYDDSDSLKTTHKTVIQKLNLYKEYLGCNVTFEEPNIYVFTFIFNDGQSEGCIKFQYDTNWTVIECKPENLLTDENIEEFHQLQDSQKLIGPLLIQ